MAIHILSYIPLNYRLRVLMRVRKVYVEMIFVTLVRPIKDRGEPGFKIIITDIFENRACVGIGAVKNLDSSPVCKLESRNINSEPGCVRFLCISAPILAVI